MPRKSFIKKISRLSKIQIVSVLALMIALLVVTYLAAEKEMKETNRSLLSIYEVQLEDRLSEMNNLLTKFLYNNGNLLLLESDDENVRHYASLELRETMKNLVNTDDCAEAMVVAVAENDICLDVVNIDVQYREWEAVRKFFILLVQEGEESSAGWYVREIEGKEYLCRILCWKHRVVSALLSVDSFLDTLQNTEQQKYAILFTDADGIVRGMTGQELFQDGLKKNIETLFGRNYEAESTEIIEGMKLYLVDKKTEIYRQIGAGMIILVCAAFILALFAMYFERSIRCELIVPMKDLSDSMNQIQQGQYDLRIQETVSNQEFHMLVSSFNKLMSEIVNLKIQYYEKRLELQEADQKYIRLQLRPHFFVNAMTTVSSMSIQGKNKEINTYINALSKNIRYMFSAGMHTVTVAEEIRHVENYFEMQELKYSDCVFHYINLPKELEKWPIPQMIIHTVIENEYKYAIKREEELVILIKISLAVKDSENMLLIEIEDDGEGYPAVIIDAINDSYKHPEQDGTRVGLWSIRRLLELMYDKTGLFELDNVDPHGAMTRIYIPEKAVNEVQSDILGEGI